MNLVRVEDESGSGFGVMDAAAYTLRVLAAGDTLTLSNPDESFRGRVLVRQSGDEDVTLIRDDAGYERDLADYVGWDAALED